MSRLTDFLKLHIWEIPKDNNEKFNYTKAIADNFDKIDAGLQNAVSKFTEPLSYKGSVLNYENLPIINTNGDIYTVTSENKNYIWNGTTWEEYSSNIDLTPIEEKIITEKTTQVAEELSIPNTAPVNGKLDIKDGKTFQKATTQGANLLDDSKVNKTFATGTRVKLVAGEDFPKKEGRLTISADVKAMTNVEYSAEGNLVSIDFEYEDGTFSYGGLVASSNKVGDRGNYSSLTTKNLKSITLVGHSRFTAGTIEIENIAIKEGTDSTYEEFIPDSPSSDYPSNIRNVGDNVNIIPTNPSEWEQGTLSNGVATANPTRIRTKDFYEVVPNQEYVFSIDIDNYTLVNINIYDENKTFISYLAAFLGLSNFDNQKTIKFTFPENAKYIKIVLRKTNDTMDILPSEIKNSKVKLENGCGSVGFKAENRNMWKPNISFPITQNGVTVNYDKKTNVYTLNGTATQTMYIKIFNGAFKKFKKGDVITTSIHKIGGKLTSQANNPLYVGGYNENDNKTSFVGYASINSTLNYNTHTEVLERDGMSYAMFWVSVSGVVFDNYQIKVQLEEGNVATDYVESKSQTVTFPMTKGQLIHKGDYLAEDGIHQNKGTLVLDGTENWTIGTLSSNENKYYFTTPVDNMKPNSPYSATTIPTILCTHFQAENNANMWTKKEDNKVVVHDSSNKVQFTYFNCTTVEQWKTYLAEQYANGTPVTVEYELAEEVVIPYTEEQEQAYYELQHLLMYEGYTSIECIDEIKPDIQLTYLYNNELNKTYGKKIDTLEARIRQLEQMITSQSEVVE